VVLSLLLIAIGVLWIIARIAETTQERSFTFTDPAQRLSVNSPAGDITVTSSSDEQVHVTRRGTFGVFRPTMREELTSSGLALEADCRWFARCRIDYRIAVPTTTAVG